LNEEVKTSNKNWKVNRSAVCFLYNIFFCVIFIIKVYTVLIYCFFFGEKVGLKRAGCGVALKRTGCWMVWKMVQQTSRHMRCWKWPLSAWTQVSSLVRHWSMIHHALLELTPDLNQLLSQI